MTKLLYPLLLLIILTGCTHTPNTEPAQTLPAPVVTQETSPQIQLSYGDNNIISRYAMVDGQRVEMDTMFQMSWPDMQDNTSTSTTLTASDGTILQISQACIMSTDPTTPTMRCDGSRWDRYLAGEESNPALDVYRERFEQQIQ